MVQKLYDAYQQGLSNQFENIFWVGIGVSVYEPLDMVFVVEWKFIACLFNVCVCSCENLYCHMYEKNTLRIFMWQDFVYVSLCILILFS